MKKYRIETRETILGVWIVEAETEREAEDRVCEGTVDPLSLTNDDWEITYVEEVEQDEEAK
jgi:hypothetical protein